MKLHVPAIGEALVLDKPWQFRLYNERRNKSLLDHLNSIGQIAWDGHIAGWRERLTETAAMLPEGVTITLDRIYMAKHNDDFHSLTSPRTIQSLRTESNCVSGSSWMTPISLSIRTPKGFPDVAL